MLGNAYRVKISLMAHCFPYFWFLLIFVHWAYPIVWVKLLLKQFVEMGVVDSQHGHEGRCSPVLSLPLLHPNYSKSRPRPVGSVLLLVDRAAAQSFIRDFPKQKCLIGRYCIYLWNELGSWVWASKPQEKSLWPELTRLISNVTVPHTSCLYLFI